MVWPQIIGYFVTLALSIALAPKPRPPKAAALEDFAFPTAEEGREIPVVFGVIDITGPNIVWYGDLAVGRIRKRSGFSRVTVGYRYSIGFHAALCHGPVNAIARIAWDDKEVWAGSITSNAVASVNSPSLYGGEGRGGGVIGDFDIEMGGAAQTANAYLTTSIGETPPAYRGVCAAVWKGGYIGDSESIRPVSFRVQRTTAGWSGSAWYTAAAAVGTAMNPAHIIYQCLTDPRWGMGVPTAFINDTVFRNVADDLFDEGFGLHLIWNQSTSIEDFIRQILEHIDGGLSFNLALGLYELTLFRADYDPDSLLIFDASNILAFSKFEKQGWGETVNEVTLTYTDPATLKATSITAQDLGNIDAQGSRLPALVSLPGIRDHAIAQLVLAREVASRSTPLTRVKFTVNRSAWALGFGSLFRLNRPERQCVERVFRVLNIDRGTLQDNSITVDAIEDIYQNELGVGIGSQTPSVAPVGPSTSEDAIDAGANVVSARATAPPGAPVDGDTYYVPPGGTGDWVGQDGTLAEWDAATGEWTFAAVPDGSIFYDVANDETLQSVGGVVAPFGGDSGGLLTTTGDLLTHDGADPVRLPVGTAGQVLRADPIAPAGLAWSTLFGAAGQSSGAAVRLSRSALQSIPDATPEPIDWTVEEFDTEDFYLPSSGDRVTVDRAGKYLTTASVQWDSNATGIRQLYVVVNPDATGGGVISGYASSPALANLTLEVATVLDLAQGDEVQILVEQDSGGARDIVATEGTPHMTLSRVGAFTVPTIPRGATWVRSVGTISVPVNDVVVHVPRNALIVGWAVYGYGPGRTTPTGSASIDVWRTDAAGFPPTVADSIAASDKPRLSAQRLNSSSALTGWSADLLAGDSLTFRLESVSGFAALFVTLFLQEVD